MVFTLRNIKFHQQKIQCSFHHLKHCAQQSSAELFLLVTLTFSRLRFHSFQHFLRINFIFPPRARKFSRAESFVVRTYIFCTQVPRYICAILGTIAVGQLALGEIAAQCKIQRSLGYRRHRWGFMNRKFISQSAPGDYVTEQVGYVLVAIGPHRASSLNVQNF